jgi:hypothetical protein
LNKSTTANNIELLLTQIKVPVIVPQKIFISQRVKASEYASIMTVYQVKLGLHIKNLSQKHPYFLTFTTQS